MKNQLTMFILKLLRRRGAWALLLLLTACVQAPHGLTTDVLLPFTPVKNQGSTASCWAYAMLSTIETEHILRGDSVHLSVAFVERVMEQMPGAPASKRAIGQTLLNIIQRYGLVQFDAMPSADLPLPRKAFFDGCEYTLQEFARSVCSPNEYVGLCTDDAQPYGSEVVLNVPDNWEQNRLLNLPSDSLLAISEHALRNRRAVCWEGDISERGFNFAEGYAVTTFLNGSTTDDHCMAIVGLAHDEEGKPYFIMKNSWGRHNPYGGLMYVSFDYFLRKTIAIYLPREVLDDGRGGNN